MLTLLFLKNLANAANAVLVAPETAHWFEVAVPDTTWVEMTAVDTAWGEVAIAGHGDAGN